LSTLFSPREAQFVPSKRMAGAQTSEVDVVLKQFLTDFPTVIGSLVDTR
jgi:hypothetical protein